MQGLSENGTTKLHLHLGCGTKYLPGFVNVDGNLVRKIDMWPDLRNSLPFPAETVSSIYASHVLERFYPDELKRLLREGHRVLRRGGGLRVVVPDMGQAVRAYVEGRSDHFFDFPRACRSLGGKLSNLLFCEGGHRQGLDFSYLEELLQDAGFAAVRQLGALESQVYSGPTFSDCGRKKPLWLRTRCLSNVGNESKNVAPSHPKTRLPADASGRDRT